MSQPVEQRNNNGSGLLRRFTSRPPQAKKDRPSLPPREHPANAQLWVDNVTVSFDGFRALNQLTLVLDEGELRCIIGPNGAGKTTLMDIITGKTRPDSGEVYFIDSERAQHPLSEMSEVNISGMGIGRKFQRPTVFSQHSVLENLELALRGPRGVWRSFIARPTSAQKERMAEVLELIGLKEHGQARAGRLSHGQKQWLEIGMLLAQDPKILLVDEPVAGMTHQETEQTAELLRSLAGKHTVVVVEHDMDFVRSIARTVSVLHEGRLLAEGPMQEVQNDRRVIEVYLGE